MKIMKLCAFLLLSVLFAGCKSPQPTLKDNSVVDTANYLLGSGDIVNINVAGQPDLTMKVVLDNSGAINYPYIGKLELKGKTASQVDAEITQRLRNGFVLNPMVTVNIAEFRKFYISGEVENPNGYSYEPGMTVEKAIALAGVIPTGQTVRISAFVNHPPVSYSKMLMLPTPFSRAIS